MEARQRVGLTRWVRPRSARFASGARFALASARAPERRSRAPPPVTRWEAVSDGGLVRKRAA